MTFAGLHGTRGDGDTPAKVIEERLGVLQLFFMSPSISVCSKNVLQIRSFTLYVDVLIFNIPNVHASIYFTKYFSKLYETPIWRTVHTIKLYGSHMNTITIFVYIKYRDTHNAFAQSLKWYCLPIAILQGDDSGM